MNQSNLQGLMDFQAKSSLYQGCLGQNSLLNLGHQNFNQFHLSVIETMRKEVAEYLKDWKE